jgi:hypothetical protein
MPRRSRRYSLASVCALIAAALALSACYASHRLLLDADAAAHPLDDGVYERDGEDHERLRLTRDPDGWYRVEAFNPNGMIGQTRRVLLNPLPLGAVKAFAAAEETDDGFVYGVVLQQGERVYLATPDCADPLDSSLAVDHGGQPEDGDSMTHNCFFKNREAVLSALSDFAGQADFGAPYTRK